MVVYTKDEVGDVVMMELSRVKIPTISKSSPSTSTITTIFLFLLFHETLIKTSKIHFFFLIVNTRRLTDKSHLLPEAQDSTKDTKKRSLNLVTQFVFSFLIFGSSILQPAHAQHRRFPQISPYSTTRVPNQPIFQYYISRLNRQKTRYKYQPVTHLYYWC